VSQWKIRKIGGEGGLSLTGVARIMLGRWWIQRTPAKNFAAAWWRAQEKKERCEGGVSRLFIAGVPCRGG
jgi:hypothetical protein